MNNNNYTEYRFMDENSTGFNSTGWRSTGNSSTGNRSTGNSSTGHWSISDRSTGDFSTIDGDYSMFNKPCTKEQYLIQRPEWLFFNITKWIEAHNMTEEEKKDNPTYKTIDGYLKVISYQEAAQQSWLSTTQEDRLATLKLPNFDKSIFKQIFGIDIDDPKWLIAEKGV